MNTPRSVLCPLSFLLVAVYFTCTSSTQYCIVGAGPGGMQMGYFLQSSGRDYIIFEKNSTAGSFFRHYPRHRKLISINKRHTGSTNYEFNWRHDWNSLLSNNSKLQMRYYSKKYFPDADEIVAYFEDYAFQLNLNISYETEIKRIFRNVQTGRFQLMDQDDQMYECQVLIMSSGLWVPHLPDINGADIIEGYESVSVDPDDFEGKTVLIIGRGNAGFETAANIVGATAYIHMASRSVIKLAFQTHYVGDLRAINDELIDTYQLKSLDGQTEIPGSTDDIRFVRAKGKYFIVPADFEGDEIPEQESELGFFFPYDVIIRCTGFKFDYSVFDDSAHPEGNIFTDKKFPRMKGNYESEEQHGMFFAGVAGHGVDFKKSAGGFIHGFRYTARALYRHLESRYHGNRWPSVTVPTSDLLNLLVKRINEASGLYQMFGVLADVAIIRDNGSAVYLEDVPILSIGNFKALTGHEPGRIIMLNFEYGKDYSGPGNDVLREGRATGNPVEADTSNFLHPVLYYYKEIPDAILFRTVGRLPEPNSYHHVVENFLTDWTSRKPHILPLRKFVESIVDADLREFSAELCMEAILIHGPESIPPSCEQHFLQGMSVSSVVDGLTSLRNKDQAYFEAF